MNKVFDNKKIFRVLDANFNRAKEGLRVCEDICRFMFDERGATKEYKILRHALTSAMTHVRWARLVGARDVGSDVGKGSSLTEFKRRDVEDIFYANSQRVKESLRVLEEFTKLAAPQVTEKVKRLRYQAYIVERKVTQRF